MQIIYENYSHIMIVWAPFLMFLCRVNIVLLKRFVPSISKFNCQYLFRIRAVTFISKVTLTFAFEFEGIFVVYAIIVRHRLG